MEKKEIIKNIAERTGGDIYLGVVGAVRTGKSTFIKKVVEKIHEYSIVGNTIVSCFDPECVCKVKEIDNNIQTALLYEKSELGDEIMSFGVAKYCKQLGVDAAHPEYFLNSH